MLLKRLELHGLKSFADKTVLDLSNSVTAVVGPNGSGKSNITDSIRWLLGERDARNLRGAKVEDLIFAGTEKRPRMGLAQATLYFDNSSGIFPVDFKEVSIARRITRDGVSQFFINKSEVRLKDLIDFLARVKLGARGLTIINQGESDTFIVASPTERREMIEETLGLKEYQLKKYEAERKLRNTGFNLEKVGALIAELKPHLRLLQRQSARYENRERISGELFELENIFYGSRFARLRDQSKRIVKEENEIEKKIKASRPGLQRIEKEFEKERENQPETIQALKEIQQRKQVVLARRGEFERGLGRVEAQLELQSSELLNEGADVKGALVEIKTIAGKAMKEVDVEKLRSMAKRIVEIVEELFISDKDEGDKNGKAQKKYDKLLSDIKSLDEKFEKLIEEEKHHQGSLEDFNKTFKDSYELIESERKKHESLIAEKNKIILDEERVGLKLKSLEEELAQIGRSSTSIGEEFDKGSAKSEVLVDEDSAVGKMFKLRQELASIGEIDESIIKESRETEKRNEFLTRQVDDLEKATKDLIHLIKELDGKIYTEFNFAIHEINTEFTALIRAMFDGGSAKLVARNMYQQKSGGENNEEESDTTKEENNDHKETVGIDIEISLPKKRVKGLDVLSGGERTLVSIAILFALISVSPPPFLVLDEIDAALDEKNAKRFGEILKEFSKKTQIVIITHNRATMEIADVLYGVTMLPDGTSKLVSLKLE